MKNIFCRTLVFSLICMVCSCQVSQRRYMKGFYVHHKSSPKATETIKDVSFAPETDAPPVGHSDTTIQQTELATASAGSFRNEESFLTIRIEKKQPKQRESMREVTHEKKKEIYKETYSPRKAKTQLSISPSATTDRKEIGWIAVLFVVLIAVPAISITLLLVFCPITLPLLFLCWAILTLPLAIVGAILLQLDESVDGLLAFLGAWAWLQVLPVMAWLTWYCLFFLPFSWLLFAFYYVVMVALAAFLIGGVSAMFEEDSELLLQVLLWGLVIVPLCAGVLFLLFLGIQALFVLTGWWALLISVATLALILFIVYLILLTEGMKGA